MSFFGDLIGGITGRNDRKAAQEYQSKEEQQRAAAKKTQYDLLGQLKGPQVSSANEARIKALEDESRLGLEVDPNFQGQLRQARVGGAQSLASIQNNQAATGAGGGFQNVGSAADVYDRLGVQLAELAGQQQQFREQKRDRAADARQAIADAQTEYENAVTNAKIAIEAGDAAAAQAALAQAYQARSAAQNKLWQNIVGVGTIAVGAAAGSPKTAQGGADVLNTANQGQGPTVAAYNQQNPGYANENYFSNQMNPANRPYYQTWSR